MQDLKKIFQRINEQKKERKQLQETYRDLLANSKPYQDALEAMQTARAKKQEIESAIRAGFQQELDRLEAIKTSMDADTQLLTDTALSLLMKGEAIELTDENDTSYEPVFRVRFKKRS